MGIDIERISDDRKDALEAQITGKEKNLIRFLPYSYEVGLTLLWSAKEALSKILKTGLTAPFYIFAINKLEVKNSAIFSFYENFPQYCTVSFIFGCYVCSMTYPKKTELSIEPVRKLLHGVEESMITKKVIHI
jgi:4'-phosphopantetheinyl transferase